ncbi:MAG: hypothetical protein E7282_02485 [Lachnospiraceae bacterium]|nr:hypothetical protein [Lachnospiraceae bacterium]
MYEAEGLLFETEEEATQARTEAEGIRYIKERTKMDDPDVILNLYNNLLQKQLFKTEVGLKFLFELQEYLVTIPYIKSEDIKPIPARKNSEAQLADLKKKQVEKKIKEKENRKRKKENRESKRNYRLWFRVTMFLTVVLSACVIGMFVIALTTKQTDLIDYENKILDKYSSWEQELSQWEKELSEREANLEEQ